MDDDPACPGVPWVPQRLLSLLNIAQHAVLGLEFLHFQNQGGRQRTLGTIVSDRLQYDPCQVVPAPDFKSGDKPRTSVQGQTRENALSCNDRALQAAEKREFLEGDGLQAVHKCFAVNPALAAEGAAFAPYSTFFRSLFSPGDNAPSSQSTRTFFVTSTTVGRRALLQSARMAQLLVDVLAENRRKKRFLLHEFVPTLRRNG